jgi:hypothetical protein
MKQLPSRMGVGASSILLILVVVSLTLFASLALVQARSDASLTDKTAASAGAFYDADVRAQRMIAALDDALKNGQAPESVEGVGKQQDGTYAFSVDSIDGHALHVAVETGAGRCVVTSYRYESAEEWVGQGAGTLWQGG